MSLASAWDDHAPEWITWARAPRHDPFWYSHWPALRALLPAPGGLVAIDLGSGEGRGSRELKALGYQVAGVDRSPALSRAARALQPEVPVALADAAALPFGDNVAGLIVACMSLQDIDDLDGAIREAGRVLRPGGQLCAAVPHPFSTAQDDETLHTESFRVSRPYLQNRRYEDHVESGGLTMTFVGMHRPLSSYTSALAANGFVISDLAEISGGNVPWVLLLRAECQKGQVSGR